MSFRAPWLRAGLEAGTALLAGFLTHADLLQTYRSTAPYISNPYTTMTQTSQDIARRLNKFNLLFYLQSYAYQPVCSLFFPLASLKNKLILDVSELHVIPGRLYVHMNNDLT